MDNWVIKYKLGVLKSKLCKITDDLGALNFLYHLPESDLPLDNNTKLLIEQNGVWKYVEKGNFKVSYEQLEQDLRGTLYNGSNTNIDWSQAVAFQLDELTSDTTFTFQNVVENKQIKLIIKGNVALTFPSNVNVDDVDYDGDVWNIIVFEATNINGSLTIKAFSL